MKKAQYLIVVGGVLLTGFLAFMPKAVVESKRSVSENKQEQENTTQAKTDSHGVHGEEMTVEQTEKIAGLRGKFELEEQKENLISLFDSLNLLYRKFNRYDSAAALSQTLVSRFPGDRETLGRAADSWFDLYGFSVTEQSAAVSSKQAIAYLEKLTEIDSENLDHQVRIGVIKVSSENPMEGILMIRKVLEKDPKNQEALFQLGLLSARSGQFDKAVSRFRQLLEVAPEREDAALALAESLIRVGKKEEAEQLLNRLKDSTKNPAVRAAARSLSSNTDG